MLVGIPFDDATSRYSRVMKFLGGDCWFSKFKCHGNNTCADTSALTQLPHKNESSSTPSVAHTNLYKVTRLSCVHGDRNCTKSLAKLTLRDDPLHIHYLSEEWRQQLAGRNAMESKPEGAFRVQSSRSKMLERENIARDLDECCSGSHTLQSV